MECTSTAWNLLDGCRPKFGVWLEQGHQCRDYVLKFSIGHATWRPLRGHLLRAAEMDDMCKRVNRERATFSPIVPIDVGLFVVYSNGVYLSGIREAPARPDPCDPPEIPLLRLVEGRDLLPRRRHDAHSRREVADRADIRQSSDTWQHPRLPPCRWTMSLEPIKFQKTKARPKERISALRFPCREQAMSVASPQGCQKARSPVTCVALVVAAACGVSAGGMTRMYGGHSLLLLSQKCD